MAEQGLAPSDPSPRLWETIGNTLLEEIYTADQAIYPAPLLTFQRLKSWADACPDLCISLHGRDPAPTGPAVQGVIIVLPLGESSWGHLVAGELREHDVEPAGMFPPPRPVGGHPEVKVGLHIFHIERYAAPPARNGGGRTPGLTQGALEEVRSRVRERFPSWIVVGYSALTATPQGNRAFKRAGFTSRYIEIKADGDEAEMLVREGNEIFTSL
ncbi:hypothetical protein N8I77_000695 [Diaporthe amygdali]|uniref:Uncharacterized protein n=1 Tax=Phomopsis amygdali TaxID=1214568 RepID=A0AAD9SQ00_PHOAM|nr:hypothetical protein N8I77_000695 [Diaporthe amygdali]